MCRRKSVAYFAHNPNHRLLPADADDDGDFTCDGCLVAGAGRRYQCSYPGCGFKLHEVCALRFPKTLKSVFHSQHRLRRRESAAGAQGGGAGSRCEVCGEDVKGACYGCGACGGGGGGLVVHPLCVRLPPVARGSASAHPGDHDAWLVRKKSNVDAGAGAASAPASCSACGRAVGAWRYRCGTCKVDVHPRCFVPATDQCRGGEAAAASTVKRCCLGLVDAVTNCLNISYYYGGGVVVQV